MTEPERDERLRADLASLKLDRSAAPTRRHRRGRPRWVLLALAVVSLALATGVLWRVLGRAPTVKVAYATLAPPGQSGAAQVLSGSGYVVTAERYVSIGVRVAGRIDRYFVEEGQSVRRGDPLVQLDDRDYRAAVTRANASLALARADLSLAEADLRRGRSLQEQAVISQQELDVLENKALVARARVRQSEAELTETKVNLEYTLLRAPTDGVVLAKLKEVGEIAVPGGFAGSGDLIRLANLNDMRAQVDVNEADLNRVRMGQPALVIPDAYPEARYEAEVVKLYPQVDRQKGTLRVEVHILHPDGRLLPDMSARITFLAEPSPAADKPTVLVPVAAVQRDTQGNSFVWIVNRQRVQRALVETAGETGDRARVATGLEGGEAVVVSGQSSLRDGDRVRVAK